MHSQKYIPLQLTMVRYKNLFFTPSREKKQKVFLLRTLSTVY
jgi:hypothetical protein